MDDEICAIEGGMIQDTKHPSDSKEPKVGTLECDTESAIILSFTALQLKRIGELQEELLDLQSNRNQGRHQRSSTIASMRHWDVMVSGYQIDSFVLTMGFSKCITELRDIVTSEIIDVPTRRSVISTPLQPIFPTNAPARSVACAVDCAVYRDK
jgi:hypothetical protein